MPENTTSPTTRPGQERFVIADDEIGLGAVDAVAYEGLKAGEEYELSATLVDKATGEPVTDVSGMPVEAKAEFAPALSTGNQDVEISFDASLLGGRDLPGAESETEGEVLGTRTFPHGVHLSVAAGLEIGRDELHFSVGEPIGVQELHGGSHLIEVAPMPMGRKFRRSGVRVHGRWGQCAADRGRKRRCNDECRRAARCRQG